jgi:ribosomal-protein-alanine N-acetyltransferase
MHVSRMAPADRAEANAILRNAGAEVDVETELSRPWARLWVAREDAGGPVLACLLAWHAADELHILQLATLPEARRRGAAKALLGAAIDYASANRMRLILLEVRHTNDAALKLYRTAGFHVIGVRRGYYERHGEDAIEMMLTLDPDTGAVQPGRDEVSS